MNRESPPSSQGATPLAGDGSAATPPGTPHLRVDARQPTAPHGHTPERPPLWVSWFAHPFANWFWFYFGFVAAPSGANLGYPSTGPVVIVGWLTGHLVNAKHPWAEIRFLLASAGMGFVADGLLTLCKVLSFREPLSWGWMIPLWMVMMWPNFAATLNSSMKWLLGRYKLGAVLGAVAGPFSYYGGEQWGAIEFGRPFWVAMIVIGIEWALAMPALLWLSARWVPREARASK